MTTQPIDLTHLPPAPWTKGKFRGYVVGPDGEEIIQSCDLNGFETINAVAEFVALARNAFAVLLTRDLRPIRWDNGTWGVVTQRHGDWPMPGLNMTNSWPDPCLRRAADP